MLTIAHWIVVLAYVIVLPIAITWTLIKARRVRNIGPAGSLIVTCLVGIVLGFSISVIYATAVQGRVVITQVLLASYFAASMLVLIKIFDRALQRSLIRVFRVGPGAPGGTSKAVRLQLAGSVRVIVLFALALPYVMAAVMTYRPKVALTDDPKSQLGFDYETVSFESTDGVPLRGWWIPALPPVTGSARDNGEAHPWGTKTVLVCHGLGANRSNQLIMARSLVPAGYNVLAFDFRAHGESGGQLTTFGDLERRDVLGAVRYLLANHVTESKRIVGVGASMGAAALISAAADESPEGKAIEAIAVYGTYDSLERLATTVANDRFIFPVDWLTTHVSFPLASLQVGVDLSDFSPANLVGDVWPRPILFIHGQQDEVIPFRRGQALYEAADVPKWHIWLQRGDHNNIVSNDFLAEVVRRFFDKAEALPVI